jgi:hypothetical protein
MTAPGLCVGGLGEMGEAIRGKQSLRETMDAQIAVVYLQRADKYQRPVH